MELIESCKHRWSVRKKIYITQSNWIEVQHCRKKCQQDIQVEYRTHSVNGQMRTDSITTRINNKNNQIDANNQTINPDHSSI